MSTPGSSSARKTISFPHQTSFNFSQNHRKLSIKNVSKGGVLDSKSPNSSLRRRMTLKPSMGLSLQKKMSQKKSVIQSSLSNEDEDEETDKLINLVLSTAHICKNPKCIDRILGYPKKHRHSVEGCKGHYFCKGTQVPQVNDEHSMIPIMSPPEMNEVRKIIRKDTLTGGPNSIENLLKNEEDCGFFGQDPPLGKDRKLVMTDAAIDSWLAAHYGLTIDKIPPNKPADMPRYIHDKLKKQFFGKDGFSKDGKKSKIPARKYRDDDEDSGHSPVSPRRGGRGPTSGPALKQQATLYQASSSFSVVPMEGYQHVTYPKHLKVTSITDKIIEEEEKKVAQKIQNQFTSHRMIKPSAGRSGSQADLYSPQKSRMQIPTNQFMAKQSTRNLAQKDFFQKSPDNNLESVSEQQLSSMINTEAQTVRGAYSPNERKQSPSKFKMTAKSSIPIPAENRYSVPSKTVRERLNSKELNSFLNYQEIALTARNKAAYEQTRSLEKKQEQERQQIEQRKLEKERKLKEIHERTRNLQMATRRLNQQSKPEEEQLPTAQTFQSQHDSQLSPPRQLSPKSTKRKKEDNRVAFSPQARAAQFEKERRIMIEKAVQKKKRAENLKDLQMMKKIQDSQKFKTARSGKSLFNQVSKKKDMLSSSQSFSSVQQAASQYALTKLQTQTTQLTIPDLKVSEEGGLLSSIGAKTARNFGQNYATASFARQGDYSGKQLFLNRAHYIYDEKQKQKQKEAQDMHDQFIKFVTGKKKRLQSAKQGLATVRQSLQDSASRQPLLSARGMLATAKVSLQVDKKGNESLTQRLMNATGSQDSTLYYTGANTQRSASKKVGEPTILGRTSLTSKQFDLARSPKGITHQIISGGDGSQTMRIPQNRDQRVTEETDMHLLTSKTERTQNEENPLDTARSELIRKLSKPERTKVGWQETLKSVVGEDEFDTQEISRILKKHSTKNFKISNVLARKMQVSKFKLKNQAVSQNFRVRNEKLTSKILSDQEDLQTILTSKFGISTADLEVPVFQQLQKLWGQKDQELKHELRGQQEPVTNEDFLSTHRLSVKTIKNKFGIKSPKLKKRERDLNKTDTLLNVNREEDDEQIRREVFRLQAIDENKLSQQVLKDLNEEDPYTPLSSDRDGQPEIDNINIPIKFILFDLSQNTFHKDFKDFRFWMILAQKRMQMSGNLEAGLDYLRNGLKEIPLNAQLMYNFSCANEKLGKYNIAIKFFQYAQKIKPRWPDALFGEAVTHFKLKDYKQAKRCIKMAIKGYKNDCLEKLEVFQYFQAMCYKNLRKFAKARRDYLALQKSYFKDGENQKILHHIIGLIMLPLKEDRRLQMDFMDNTMQLVSHFKKAPAQDPSSKLQQYVNKSTGFLNMEAYRLVILQILKNAPFFKRFDLTTLAKYLQYAQPVVFKKDELLFLDGRVGVITHGSVRVLSHAQDLLSPFTLAKYGPGRILGHQSDDGVTSHSQTWLVNYDEGTEMLIFDRAVFNKLWKIQFLKVDRQIIEANIECNQLLRCLSDQSQYQIIYEDMQIRKFRPGQLICRMSKRSKLNKIFAPINSNTNSRLLDDLETQKLIQQTEAAANNIEAGEEANANQGGGETLVSGFVKRLTSQPTRRKGTTSPVKTNPTSPQSPSRVPIKAISEESELEEDSIEGLKMRKVEIQPEVKANLLDMLESTNIRNDRNIEKFRKHPQYLNYLDSLYRDQAYREVDGVYIIYKGHVDVLSHEDNHLITQVNIFEHFGESKLLKMPSYEYLGDLYAGLHPKVPKKKEDNVLKLFKKQLTKNVRELRRSQMNSLNTSKLTEEDSEGDFRQMLEEENRVTDTSELNDDDECTICLYIPYYKLDSLPSTEISKIREKASLKTSKPGLYYYVSQLLKVSEEDLLVY